LIKDITLGQFFPGQSVIHRLDPRIKISLLMGFIVTIFMASSLLSVAVVLAALFALIAMTRIPLKTYLRGLKSILVIILFVSLLNIFYGRGEPLWEWWIFKITMDGILRAFYMTIRIASLILTSSVLTYTTSPTDMTDGLERLMKPLKYIKVPVHDIAMMMTIALRSVPMLLEETEKIMNAQKSRGADLESGGLLQRIRAMVPILVPLFVSAYRNARDMADAMEARCYQGGDTRTRMKILHMQALDYRALVSLLLLALLVVLLNTFLAIMPLGGMG